MTVVPSTMRIPVKSEYVFPHGALFLGVEPVTDFDKRGQVDDQARDKDTDERLWQVRVLDLDPDAGRFGVSKEVKVKIPAPVQPVAPPPSVPGYPPMVEFTDVTITPYVNSQRRCTDKCKARLAWSVRAGGMVPAQGVSEGKPAKAAA